MYYFLISLLLVGCAFKGEENKSPLAALNGNVSRIAELSWESGNGAVIISRAVLGEKNFSIPDPVSLPPEIPDLFRIAFNAPLVSGKLLQEPRVFISDLTDEKSVNPPVRLKGVLDASGISISGLQMFFAVNKQQKGVVRVSLMNAVTGDEEASLGLTLISTPISADVSLVGKERMRDSDVKRLLAPQLRLDLLYVVQIRNTNLYRAEFVLPGELHGSLQKDFLRYDFSERECSTESGSVPWTETYETRFFVLPLDESLRETWSAKLNDTARTLVLKPGEARNVGIYAAGAQVSRFVDSGCPSSQHGMSRVVVSCRRVCDGNLMNIGPGPGDGPGHACHGEPVYGSVPSGLDTQGAYWLLDEESTLMRARNAFLGANDDPASRTLHFLQARQAVF